MKKILLMIGLFAVMQLRAVVFTGPITAGVSYSGGTATNLTVWGSPGLTFGSDNIPISLHNDNNPNPFLVFSAGSGIKSADGSWVIDGFGNATFTSVSGGSIITSNVLYVSKNGNDSTGTRARLDLPFLTPDKARDNSKNGDLITLYPGTYTNTLSLSTNNVNFNLMPGTTLYCGTNATPNVVSVFSDLNCANGITNTVSGEGDLIALFDTADFSTGYGIYFQNSKTVASIHLHDITLTTTNGGIGDAGMFGLNVQSCKAVDFECNNINSVNDIGSGVSLSDGRINVKFNTIEVGGDGVQFNQTGSTPEDVVVNGDSILSKGQSLHWSGSSNPKSVAWITIPVIVSTNSAAVNWDSGTLGKSYITSQKIWTRRDASSGDGGQGAIYNQAMTNYIITEKVAADGDFWVIMSGGLLDLTCQHYEDTTNSQTSGIWQSAGTMYLHGGHAKSGGACIRFNGGTGNCEDLILDSSSHASNVVFVTSSGLTLKNCTLIASNNINSIGATNAQTVTIDGTLTVNTDPSSNVSFNGGGTLIVTAGTNSSAPSIDAPWGSKYYKSGSTNFWFKDSGAGTAGWTAK